MRKENPAVTKSELIVAVSASAPSISKRDIAIIVDTVFDSMASALVQRDRIEIRGFGSFVSRQRRARNGRNPRTGDQVLVPEKWVPTFMAGKDLRERINVGASD